jgi:hypothetical protein
VPRGKLRLEVWEKQKRLGMHVFHERYRDVLENISEPFATAVTEQTRKKHSLGYVMTVSREHETYCDGEEKGCSALHPQRRELNILELAILIASGHF